MTRMRISKDLSYVGSSFTTWEEAIKTVCNDAKRLGYVNEGFSEDLLSRERMYPTGIQAAVPIALPHVGTNCNISFISLLTLKEPLNFRYMDGTAGYLPVQIILLLGVADDEQPDVLRRLLYLLRDQQMLMRILAAKDDKEGCEMLAGYLGDLVELE